MQSHRVKTFLMSTLKRSGNKNRNLHSKKTTENKILGILHQDHTEFCELE